MLPPRPNAYEAATVLDLLALVDQTEANVEPTEDT
jgi:hypothetical protein